MQKEIEDYITAAPVERQTRLRHILQAIERQVPQAVQVIKHKMPTFQLGENWLAVANQKSYISIYTVSNDQIEGFKTKYPKVKTGTGCINLKDSDPLDTSDLALVTSAVFK